MNQKRSTMKRQVIIATAMVLCLVTVGAVEGVAQQIFNQFRQPELVVGRPYRDLDNCPASAAAKQVLPANSFVLPPVNTVNLDDGYSYIQFPANFTFRYNGVDFNGIYVSVNGFATFDGTKLVPAKQSAGLFVNSSSYPDNVLAPFWGDHRIRTAADIMNGYMPSEISWAYDVDRDENCDTIKPVRQCVVIQWKNLNINDQSINSSVGNFQVRLYEAPQSSNYQGDVEFAYGQVGGNPYTNNTIVVTKGATVGVKGNGGFPGYISDFWNGLVWQPMLGSNSRTDSTTRWQPSDGRSDAVIRFSAIVYLTFDMWGYGDADTSAAHHQRHENMAQNRRVTANDARVIMRSIVTKRPLDSVWKRQAYQGDVNHSGRYYFTKLNHDFTQDSLDGLGNIVIWRRTIDVDQFTGKQVLRVMYEGDGLYGIGGRAPDVSSLSQIYYEVSEYDAGLIMRYLSGRLPFLPWVWDNDTTGPDFGKVSGDNVADNIRFGEAVSVGNGLVRIPVYFNAAHSGAFGARFELNSDIVGISGVEVDGNSVGTENSNSVAVLAGNGQFDPTSPVAYLTVKAAPTYTVSNIRFNEIEKGSVTLNGGEVANASALSVYPNPVNTNASLVVNVPASGELTVNVYDVYGKLVATLFNGVASNGTMPLSWNATDLQGNSVAAGAYVVRVTGAGLNETTKISVTR